MPVDNLNSIIPFHLGGRGGAAKCSPIVFLVIFPIISGRVLIVVAYLPFGISENVRTMLFKF